jgi:aminopeptidase YwaD
MPETLPVSSHSAGYLRATMLLLRSLLLSLCLLPLALVGQTDPTALELLRADVRHLASTELEGREAGTAGEKLAADHIAAAFRTIGLEPAGSEGSYLQPFTFNAQPVPGPANSLQLGRRKLSIKEDYHPLSFSATGVARGKIEKLGFGIHAPDLQHDDLKDAQITGRVVAVSISSPDGIHPHSKFLAHHDLRERAARLAERGAVAVVFYTDDAAAPTPSQQLSAKGTPLAIPVIFLRNESLQELLVDNNPCVVNVDIVRERLTGYNVVGRLRKGGAHVVVIGAHYDHLGWGDEGSLHRGERAIHHGADDNASGVAVMLQLARDLKNAQDLGGNDVLFIAFSGEEKGLYGSNHWTKEPTVPIAQLTYMINMDMVGRLDSLGNIGINGVGTSPAWAVVDSISDGGLKAKTTTSGIGPSDHTSFYLQDIPAIHYFTGTHADYHKPSDTEEKINYDGMLRVRDHILALMRRLDGRGKLPFTRTAEVNTENAPRFKVTLGVVPDYMYDGQGMRIDGVTEGKPAANAGLRKGDIVLRIGSLEVGDMMSYMKALGQFNKGDTAPVTVLREGKEVEVNVTF